LILCPSIQYKLHREIMMPGFDYTPTQTRIEYPELPNTYCYRKRMVQLEAVYKKILRRCHSAIFKRSG
ncbi:MAG: hypothetical protein WCA51_00535, partial [Dehalococcoidia bacterium]